MLLEIFPLLLIVTLIIFIVLYNQSIRPIARDDHPLLEQEEDPKTESKKKIGKKKLKHLERKEQEKRYREYMESVKEDQLLREDLKAEARERQNAKLQKSRRRQEELEIQELNKRIQSRLLKDQMKQQKEMEELKRLADLRNAIMDYIKEKLYVTWDDLQNKFSIDAKLMDDIQAEMQLLKFSNVYIYVDDKEQVYNFILDKGVVDEVDILDFFSTCKCLPQ